MNEKLTEGAMVAAVAASARALLLSELPESYSIEETSNMPDDEAIETAVGCGLLEG